MRPLSLVIDINVILDVLLDRAPFATASAAVWWKVEAGSHRGLLAAHAFPTIHYLIRKSHGSQKSDEAVARLRVVFGVASVDSVVVDRAVQLAFPDFEDALTAASAERAGAKYIVTRDLKGFLRSPVQAVLPEQILAMSLNISAKSLK